MSVHIQNNLFTTLFWLMTKLIFWAILGFIIAQVITLLLLVNYGQHSAFSFIDHLTRGQLSFLNSSALHNCYVSHWIAIITSNCNYCADWIIRMVQSVGLVNITLPFVKASINTLYLSLLRLANVASNMSIYALAGFLGLTDGLVQRTIRKKRGGRESALTYHKAKQLIFPSLCIGSFVYLILPLTVAPTVIFLPCACLFGFSISLTARSFKKYI